MPLAEPNNCWPFAVKRFSDALAASLQFRTLVGLDVTATEEQVLQFVFGKKLTHAMSGHAWTREEMEELRHYAQVYSDPGRPYAKTRTSFNSWEPSGAIIITLGRLITESQLGEYQALPDAMERDWENIVGTLIDQLIAWCITPTGTGGAPHLRSIDVTDHGEQEAKRVTTQGYWQFAELTCQYGLDY